MNSIEIYQKYYLPEHLQLHMLRVAACASLILENWIGPEVQNNSIIRALLLHDMGNMAKMREEEVIDEKFRKIRNTYIEEYGMDDDKITREIGKKEGLTLEELDMLKDKSSKNNEKTLMGNPYEVKICAYCDQRVSPNGVTSIKERLEEVKKRYKDRIQSVWSNEDKANHLIECSLGIEQQIMQFCKIKPEEINDETIEPYIQKLKEYEIN